MLLFASLGAVAALSGCGGGFAMGSSPKSYTVTVTGTSGANNQTTTVQLTVE
jgi:ABC-type glycerol-3-phosphate transport system substrate-binding protein